ncbi:hypothetical protein [Micromonospora sp. 067-2]|uniref:hypothetical protein n=1 Tax=Micromonospora sp. 067-2 TaxID=2789270 RepID=UPI00397920CA
MTDNDDKTVNRRRLLRRAGTVAAGVAGTTVVGAAIAGPAQADQGQPVLQGVLNSAGNSNTTLSSTSAGPTLRLANTNKSTNPDGVEFSGPALHLTPSGDYLNDQSPVGSLGVDKYGNFQVVSAQYQGEAFVDFVHTTGNSNQIVPIVPQRLVDTRAANTRTRIINASSNLDSSGRLRDGKTIHIDLSDFVFFGDALFGNLTVTTAVASGFVQIFPFNTPRPANFSTINYLPNQVISNSFVAGIGSNATDVTDAISVYAARTTHIIIDVVAFVVGVGSVNPGILPSAAGATARGESPEQRKAKRAAAAKQGTPSWK